MKKRLVKHRAPTVGRKIGKTDIRIELIDVDAALANKWLKRRARNRKVVEFHAKELMADMKEGNWVFNGIPLCFNQEDELIEGQHRLEAVAQTGITQTFVVIWGIEQAAFDTYDLHRRRSTVDYLSMDNIHYAPQLAAASRYLTQFVRHGNFYSKEPATHKEKMETIEKYPDLTNFVAAYAREKLPIKISPAILSTCHIIFKWKNAAAADEYMDGVVMGENIRKGDPRYAVRAWIIARPTGDIGWAQQHFSQRAGNVLIHGWNLWRTGETLTTIKPIRETPEVHA
jgi:hypothetical protein